MAEEKFLRGAMILTAAGLLVKIAGSVNRILLSRFLGGEGIGLYQMAYPVYLLLSALSSAGIPVAISIVMAGRLAVGDRAGAQKAFKISLAAMLCAGLFFSFVLYWSAGWLVGQHIIRDARAYYALVALTPAVFFATALASMRGYFQGFQQMLPTAVSQIAEQILRVAAMLFLAWRLFEYGLEYAAAGAAFGAVPGTAGGLLVLLFFYWRRGGHPPPLAKETPPAWPLAKQLAKLALPVSLANIMIPLVASVDALIVPARLEAAGFAVREATALFGYLAGMALPLVMMAAIPTTSLATSLVPAVSESYALKDAAALRNITNLAARLACVITVPCFLGLAVLSEPVSRLLYGTPEASLCIRIMSAAIFFLGLQQVTAAVLQGMGRAGAPMGNMLASALVKVGLTWSLAALPAWGIAGAAWASVVDFALSALLNLFFLYKYTGFLYPVKAAARVFAAAGLMVVCAREVYRLVFWATGADGLATVSAIFAGAFAYLPLLPLTGCVTRAEAAGLPVLGRWIIKIFAVRDKLWKNREN
ncbi:MAG: polysaccharide biosynthesis protein [Acidaminococcales bacterium]|nr:polysaccharide biosynthesis protein [Acidaminococcales bacterium]